MARRILLADDSVTAQNMGRRILTDAGYEVVTVNNGSAALKKIAENKPDIIVLDVYMPGYGGLEVCQRIKEAPETARIPVLLTVGKLEPFKPDEARRVGADAFIIKPFEATELLTALTKLEDKIVAGPQPLKSGRFAKTLAAVERSDAGERFGDKETGWKNRLTIPGLSRSKPAEAEAPEAAAVPARDFDRGEVAGPVEAKPEFERPIPAGLPADITPEEIAAITAAAASFEGKAAHPTVIPEGSASESAATMQAASAETVPQPAEPETPVATLATATGEENAAPAAPPETVAEVVASGDILKTEDIPAAAVSEVSATSEAPVAESHEAPAPEIEKPSSGDAELMAAIASLAPSNGNGSESAPADLNSHEPVPAAVGFASAVEARITGPRWIAESVAVSPEESALALEQEMEFAAAAQATVAKAAAEAAQQDAVAATTVELAASAAPTEASEPAIAEAASVADAVATLSISAAIVEEVPAASAELQPAPQSEAQDVRQEAAPAEAKEESAYAAAASASSSFEPVSTVELISSPAVPAETSAASATASVEVAPQREAELAAAWQNWKQIRESFVSAQPAASTTEASPAEASVVQEEPTAAAKDRDKDAEAETAEAEAAEAQAESEDTSGESNSIASIVDSMLAELRPKLVEEIAKKMSSEKKEKEKEKDRDRDRDKDRDKDKKRKK